MKNLFLQPSGSTSRTTSVIALARKFNLTDKEVIFVKADTTLTGIKGIYDKNTSTFWLIPSNVGSTLISFIPPLLKTNTGEHDLTDFNIKFENYHIMTQYSFDKGFTLNYGTQVVEFEGELYRWGGGFPKQVPVSSTGVVITDSWVAVNPTAMFYTTLRAYKGNARIINILGIENIFDKASGVYIRKDGDTTTRDDGGCVIVDALGRRWHRDYVGDVSATWFGAKPDATFDNTLPLRKALDNVHNKRVYLERGIWGISDTIRFGRGKSLIGSASVFRTDSWSTGTTLKYIGDADNRKAMLLLGAEVGEEPTKDSSANHIENIFLDGSYKIGFLMYGTFLTNDTMLRGIGGIGSTEYNFYFAKAWYCTIENIFSRNCKNVGIAIAMPLIYSDGTRVNWTSSAPLEFNQCKVSNIRSHSSGEKFSIDAPKTYDPKNPLHRMSGYGLGLGDGNGFRVENFLSERSGGVNLYYWLAFQPSKTVKQGYLENGCLNSGLDPASTMPSIIIDTSEGRVDSTGNIISDVFTNYNSGGVYTYKGNNTEYTQTVLQRIFQPRFLKDLEGTTDIDNPKHPLNIVTLHNVYYGMGYYNTRGGFIVHQAFDINTRYDWSQNVPCYDTMDYFQLYIRVNSDTFTSQGSIEFVRPDGTKYARNYPTNVEKGKWVRVETFTNIETIRRSGAAGTVEQKVDFKIVKKPYAGYV